MTRSLRVGDRVAWNSEAGRVTGVIFRKITSEIVFKGYRRHALEGRATVSHQERSDRSCGHPQSNGTSTDQENTGAIGCPDPLVPADGAAVPRGDPAHAYA